MMTRILLLLTGMTAHTWAQYSRGVNLAGAEFGENKIPGSLNTDYTYNSEASFRYFGDKNLTLIRLPIRWERLQPTLDGPLEALNLNALKRDIGWAKAHGDRVIIDVHNYGRYKINEGGAVKEYVIDNFYDGVTKVSGANLADLWLKLSNEFKLEPVVYAYDLMNEPHDMGTADWKSISQAVLTAIRNHGDDKLIMVPGDNYSSADRWPVVHGPVSWISDPAGNFVYEAHQYFDRDNSGTYTRTYDQELALNPNLATVGQTRLAHFVDWCRSNGVKGFLGEYGIPGNDPRWDTVLDNFLRSLDDAGFDGSYWAAGEWWGPYSLSIQPQSNFSIDKPHLGTLAKHLAAPFFTTLPAATSRSFTLAPAALAAGYGAGLASVTQAAALPLATSIGGMQVELTDSSGSKTLASLIYVSPTQINYVVPAGTALGRVTATVQNMGRAVATGSFEVENVAPAVFSANGNGYGVAAAQILRIKSDGTQSYEPVARLDQQQQAFVAEPIDFGDPSDRLFVLLYGSGFRNLSGLDGTSLQIGPRGVPLLFAGAQPDFPGLDQANAELPRSLSGAGEVAVILKVDGKTANPVTLVFR